jgi:hypothetical protein
MDADDPNEMIGLGFPWTSCIVALGSDTPNSPLIGVHRRPSAVNSSFALIGD